MELFCFDCKKANSFQDKVGFREECRHCRADLHVCKNCEFYDAKAYNECRETSADVIREKDRSNLCDFFKPRQTSLSVDDQKAQLKSAADSLFKKN
jgi:hypothetical protein